MPFPLRPWGSDYVRDEEGYKVIRGVDFRPLAYVERSLDRDDEEMLALLFSRSPELLEQVKAVFFANAHEWTSHDWRLWRERTQSAIDGLVV